MRVLFVVVFCKVRFSVDTSAFSHVFDEEIDQQAAEVDVRLLDALSLSYSGDFLSLAELESADPGGGGRPAKQVSTGQAQRVQADTPVEDGVGVELALDLLVGADVKSETRRATTERVDDAVPSPAQQQLFVGMYKEAATPRGLAEYGKEVLQLGWITVRALVNWSPKPEITWLTPAQAAAIAAANGVEPSAFDSIGCLQWVTRPPIVGTQLQLMPIGVKVTLVDKRGSTPVSFSSKTEWDASYTAENGQSGPTLISSTEGHPLGDTVTHLTKVSETEMVQTVTHMPNGLKKAPGLSHMRRYTI